MIATGHNYHSNLCKHWLKKEMQNNQWNLYEERKSLYPFSLFQLFIYFVFNCDTG